MNIPRAATAEGTQFCQSPEFVIWKRRVGPPAGWLSPWGTGSPQESWWGLSRSSGGAVSLPHHVTFKMCCGAQKPTAVRAATSRDYRLRINTRAAVNCCKKQPRGSELNDLLSQCGRSETGQHLGKYLGLSLSAPNGRHFTGRTTRGNMLGPWSL